MEDVAQWNVRPVETFTAPPSPPSSLIKPTDPEKPELEPEKDGLTGKYGERMFRSHEQKSLHKNSQADFFFPHVCTVTDCSDVSTDPVETDLQADESSGKVNEECIASTEEESNTSALNGKAAVNKGKSMFQRPQNAVNMQDWHDA